MEWENGQLPSGLGAASVALGAWAPRSSEVAVDRGCGSPRRALCAARWARGDVGFAGAPRGLRSPGAIEGQRPAGLQTCLGN